MRHRLVAALLVFALAGCAHQSPPVRPSAGTAWAVRPAGVEDPADLSGTTKPAPACGDPRASLRPDDTVAPGSALAKIVQRGYLVAGVNQNAYRVGYRDPASGSRSTSSAPSPGRCSATRRGSGSRPSTRRTGRARSNAARSTWSCGR